MIGESQRLKETIESFASSLGISAEPALDGSYSFTFSKSGVLCFTASESGERLTISLCWKDQLVDSDARQKLLRRAGFDARLRRFIHSVESEDGAFLHVVDLGEAEASLSEIDLIVQRLLDLRQV